MRNDSGDGWDDGFERDNEREPARRYERKHVRLNPFGTIRTQVALDKLRKAGLL